MSCSPEGEGGPKGDEQQCCSVAETGLVWVGAGQRIPVILFSANAVQQLEHPIDQPFASPHRLTFTGVIESKLVRSMLLSHGFSEVSASSSHFNLMWTSNFIPGVLQTLLPFQKVNHFPRASEMTRKDKLCRNVQRMQVTKGMKHFNIIPKTFVLPEDYHQFLATCRKQAGTWIVKPIGLSRGRGISLIDHPNQLPRGDPVVVSRYVENPLCIDGFKFDLRLYVAVTSYDPLRVYLYEEGLTRFASVQYAGGGEELNNLCMHLTNYSVNKMNADYVRCDDPEIEDYGSKWSMSALLRHLQGEGVDTEELMMKIEDVIIKTFLSAEFHVSAACRTFKIHRGNCFELHGFDILIDENLQPWLLEVNLSPSLSCDTPMDLRIKSNLVADLLSLTGIVVRDPFTRELKKPPNPIKARPWSRRPTSGGLSAEEIAVFRESKEEYARRGGFVRIIPSEDSWELYGSFFESRYSLNYVLHSQLYPDKVRTIRHSLVSLASVIAKRLKRDSKDSNLDSPHGLSALQRVAVYARKLPSHGPARPPASIATTIKPSSQAGRRSTATLHSTARDVRIHVLGSAPLLTKLQARQAFAAYLECVQQRLLRETSSYVPDTDAKENDQMNIDMVIRFLKKASMNLRTRFTVVVPNHELPLRDRRRILARQLAEFVTLYSQETSQLEKSPEHLSSQVLNTFLSQASEDDMERLLAAYVKQNKSSSTFLGSADRKKPTTRTVSVSHQTASTSDVTIVRTPNETLPPTHSMTPLAYTTPQELPSDCQKSLESMTNSLAGWSCQPQQSRAEKPPSPSAAVMSLPSDSSRNTTQPRRLSFRSSTNVQKSASQPSIISQTKSFVSPYAQPVCVKSTTRQPKPNSKLLTLHPALSEESITLALQRLSHRQNTTKTGQPVIAKAPFEPGKTSEHSRNPKEQTDHINEIGPDIHDQFVPTGGSHSYPSSPTYGGAVYSQGNPHLWSHIQTHNQAIQQLNSYSQVPHCGSKSLEP